MYFPSSFVIDFAVDPVDLFVAVTVIPGIRFPELSETTPEIEAASDWPFAGITSIANKRIAMAVALTNVFIGNPPKTAAVINAAIIDPF